jgi:hypothetical protein
VKASMRYLLSYCNEFVVSHVKEPRRKLLSKTVKNSYISRTGKFRESWIFFFQEFVFKFSVDFTCFTTIERHR